MKDTMLCLTAGIGWPIGAAGAAIKAWSGVLQTLQCAVHVSHNNVDMCTSIALACASVTQS